MRNRDCTSAVVADFMERNSAFLSRDQHLVFNVDETSACFTRRFKVVLPEDCAPFTEAPEVNGHVICVLCCNAAGWYTKPFFILQNLQNLPVELGVFSDDAVFSGQTSGWMTRFLWFRWCVEFCHQVGHYRLTLPPSLRSQRITLLSDGHASRRCPLAASYLLGHGVDLVILPPHTSHALQPFDVGLAAPFKCRARQFILRPDPRVRGVVEGLPSAAARQRFTLVSAVLSAWKATCNRENCQAAFEFPGYCPFSIEKALQNRWVRQVPATELPAPPTRYSISSKAITYNELILMSREVIGQAPPQVTFRDILDTRHMMKEGVVYSRPTSNVLIQGNYIKVIDF